jgi:transcriptional regulator with XRE-family HTH domain
MGAGKKRVTMTANQLVASNLTLYRSLRGWTQRETCDRLEPLLGLRWSPAVLSAAERSAEGQQRRREFSADEIVAFSRLFGVPVGAFFEPPDGIEFQVPDKPQGLSPAEIAAVVQGDERVEVRRRARAMLSLAIAEAIRQIEYGQIVDIDGALASIEREQ